MDLFDPPQASPSRDVFSVSRLNREVRALLEGNFPLIWLEGEVSNFSRPASGHWYFSLKDDKAQVRCAMFRSRNIRLRQQPKNGDKVLIRARISVYEPRGEYQLLAEHIEPAGEGELQRRFEALKAQLQAEGLFDPALKQDLPAFPHRIGIITSPSGAAIRDVLSVLRRRYPMGEALIYPVQVQGAPAPADIASTIRLADQRGDCDVLLLVRGGGSLEDLWAFNEEAVARAIAACATPLISGVGHETDFTIADFVADRRAPTPSVAAEMIAPDSAELLKQCQSLHNRLRDEIRYQLENHSKRAGHVLHRLQLQHPRRQLQQQSQRLDELSLRLQRATRVHSTHADTRLRQLQLRLMQNRPELLLERNQTRLVTLQQRLQRAANDQLNQQRQRLALASRSLNNVSPLQTLERGYAIALRASDGKAIKAPEEVNSGDKLNIRLARGQVITTVD